MTEEQREQARDAEDVKAYEDAGGVTTPVDDENPNPPAVSQTVQHEQQSETVHTERTADDPLSTADADDTDRA